MGARFSASRRKSGQDDQRAVQRARVCPIAVPETHAIFNSFFQVRNAPSPLRNQNAAYGSTAEFLGYFEDNDPRKRLMVICDVNENVKDYSVWSSMGRDAIDVSIETYKLGINYLMYTLTH